MIITEKILLEIKLDKKTGNEMIEETVRVLKIHFPEIIKGDFDPTVIKPHASSNYSRIATGNGDRFFLQRVYIISICSVIEDNVSPSFPYIDQYIV